MITENVELDVLLSEIFSDTDFNCRGTDITPGSVVDLAEDIRTNPGGLLQRIIIQPWTHEFNETIKYRLVAGHRRYAAVKLLKWKSIPAKIVVGLTQAQAEIINLTENIKRKDLNIMQEAKAVGRMCGRGMSASIAAKSLDVSVKWVQQRLALLKLPTDVQTEAAAGMIKACHIEELLKLKSIDVDRMYEAVRSIKNRDNDRRKIKVKPTNEAITQRTASRQFRNMSDVFKIQDLVLDAIGTNLASQALAWVIGEIELFDLLKAVKEEADVIKVPWSIPQEYIGK